MAISFTQSIISRLKREIAELEAASLADKKKQDKAGTKLKQLQKDSRLAHLPSDLNNKLTRINKLNAEITELTRKQADASKQLAHKKAELKKLLP
jgi:chromosome segregation ATPase